MSIKKIFFYGHEIEIFFIPLVPLLERLTARKLGKKHSEVALYAAHFTKREGPSFQRVPLNSK